MTDLEIRGISALIAKLLDEATRKSKRESLEEIERRITEIIAALPPGAQGPQGPQGFQGDYGPQGLRGEPGDRGERGERGDAGLPGESGPKGEPGEAGPAGPEGPAGAVGEAGPQGVRGETGPQGPAGKDGAAGPAGERGIDGKDGRDGREGKDGRDGLDALSLNPITAVDFERTYPLGQWASFNGGLFRYDGLAWVNMVDGIYKSEEIREGRTTRVLRHYASGKTEEFVSVTSEILYRDIFKDGEEYQRGDVVTWGGSGWHCNAEKTKQKPGTGSDWRLFVKRGADADKKKEPPPEGPIRIQ